MFHWMLAILWQTSCLSEFSAKVRNCFNSQISCLFCYIGLETVIGKLYCWIDSRKGCRPDIINRFVVGIISSNRNSDQPMAYDAQPISSISSQLKMCTENVGSLNFKCTELKNIFQRTWHELKTSNVALRDITSENTALKQKGRDAKRMIQELMYTNATLRDEYTSLQTDLITIWSRNWFNYWYLLWR